MNKCCLRWWVGLLTVALTGAASWPLRDYVIVRNLCVVEPGGIYRGAEQKAAPLRRLIRSYGIRTIVCLVDPEPDEQAVAESMGVQWLWVPVGDSSKTATFDALERMSDILADPSQRPVFFHCRRGIYRSNMAQAVYRMKSCRWTLDQSMAELRTVGFDSEERGGDRSCADLLASYYQERILAPSAAKESLLIREP